jgi:hypothetical protein
MYGGGWKRYWWRHPLSLIASVAGAVLLFILVSKILIVLAFLSGGVLFLLIILWLLWRWW